MKYNKRMMKSRPDYDLFRNDTEEKYEIDWKKIFWLGNCGCNCKCYFAHIIF